MVAEGLDVQRVADQIYHYEMAYLSALRENLAPYESIRDAFPNYFLGYHLIEAYLARDGVVVVRFGADEDSFTFFPQGIPTGEPEVSDELSIQLGGGQRVVEIAQRLSGWIEFGVPEDGRPYRFDLGAPELHGVIAATGEPFVGTPPWQLLTLPNSFTRDQWNPQLARERAAKNV